jgi:hypothetical protein
MALFVRESAGYGNECYHVRSGWYYYVNVNVGPSEKYLPYSTGRDRLKDCPLVSWDIIRNLHFNGYFLHKNPVGFPAQTRIG